LGGIAFSQSALAKGDNNGQPKVTICHVDQETGEEKTISISNKALSKHLANHIGDHSGECVDEPEPPFCEPNICDDGNECTLDVCDEAGDSCSNNVNEGAACGTAGTCDAGGQCVEPFCGDGTQDAGEQCDDGNNNNGDGCSASCTIEPFCGDGITKTGEQCDDGNNTSGDGCTDSCLIEFCGDGVVNNSGTETCDDGNIGCVSCQLPTGTGPDLIFICACGPNIHTINIEIPVNICVEDIFDSDTIFLACDSICSQAEELFSGAVSGGAGVNIPSCIGT